VDAKYIIYLLSKKPVWASTSTFFWGSYEPWKLVRYSDELSSSRRL